MKKILLIILIIFSAFIIGCEKENKPVELEKITSIELSFNSNDKLVLVSSDNSVGKLIKEENEEDEIGLFTRYVVEITPNEGFKFEINSARIKWNKTDDEEAVISKISTTENLVTITFKKYNSYKPKEKEKVSYIYYEFYSDELKFSPNNEEIVGSVEEDVEVNKEENKITTLYQILITPIEEYEFSTDITLVRNNDDGTNLIEQIIENNKVILKFEKIEYQLFKIEINLDTKKYEVSSDSEFYSAEIVKPLDYIYIVTKVTFDIKPSSELEFVVNGETIDNKKYKIEEIDDKYVLTYKIDDPNWTPYY